jgi:eukaryotic-like serine/threonine-protein kinase
VLLPGEVLDDRYRLDHRLATGGMGDVWRATDTVLGRPVAIKVMLPALLTDPGFMARFQAEARMMATLRHPGVVQVYDYGQTKVASGDVVYLVMTYVDGEPLSRRLAAAGRLPVAETLRIVAQAADALQAVHQSGIVHRDVKPANLLVQPDGTVVLVDFGVARSTAATKLTGTGNVVGTALYMAPEQISGEPVSGATDVYALGALTFHCIAGHPPFEGDNALQIAFQQVHDEPPPLPEDVPAAVRALVDRALAKQPADRFPDAAAFAQAARAAVTEPDADAPTEVVAVAPVAGTGPATLTDLPVAAGRFDDDVDENRVDEPNRRPGRRAALLAAAVVVPLLLILTAMALVLRSPGQRNTPAPAQPGSASVSATPTTTGPAKNTGTNTKASTGPTRTAAPAGASTTAPPQRSTPPTGPPRTSNPGGGSTAPTPASTANPAATTTVPTVQD